MADLVVVSWDGAPPDAVRRWADAGKLPNLAELARGGAWGTTVSTVPPVTAPAWASFHTGVGPGKHGVFEWAVRRPGSYIPALADGRSLALPTVWEILSNHVPVGVLGYPLTHPARPVRGFWIPGFLAPPDADGHPPGIMATVRESAPGFLATPPEWSYGTDPTAWATELADLAEHQAWAAVALADRFRPAVLAVHFQITDTVQHYLGEREEVLAVFQAADRALGMLINALAPRRTILLSDHGMGPVDGEFHINTWLLAEGFLHLRRRPTSTLRGFLFRRGVTPMNLAGLGQRLYPLARRLGFLHNGLELWGDGALARGVRRVFLSLEDVDWSKTVAYSHAEIGSIYLNRVGREPRGTVAAADAPRVRRDLAQALAEVRLPTGEPLLGDLYFGEELYRGDKAWLGPDILFLPRGLRWLGKGIVGFLHHTVFSPSPMAAGHRMEGVLVVSGEDVPPGQAPRAHLWDLAPTILALCGVPIPSWMDGQPLMGAFGDMASPPAYVAEPVPGRDSAGEDTIRRLRGLGYL
ncbi:alkaline phosphatase family protein [Candidatus Bipolaricaulota bacterium]|nr:alkaline phosphatase family protein [Candidatus Bipolaricaulota bacterium]